MAELHYDHTVLSSFLLGHLGPAETRAVVRHLLTGCETCRHVAESIWENQSGMPEETPARSECTPTATLDLESVFARVRDREVALEREKAQAPVLYHELSQHPTARQLMIVRNSRRFSTWGLCEHLIDLSFESRFDDVNRTEGLASLAVAIAEEIDRDHYGEALSADLQARAWAHLGNAQRIRGDYRSAEESLQMAEHLLEHGTGDPLELATLLSFYGTLRSHQGRHDEAACFSDRIIAIYERAGDRHWVGANMAEKATALYRLGQCEEAIPLLRRGIELMDSNVDARRILVARHNLVYFLQDAGRLDEALELLHETKPLYVELGDRLNLLRLRRLEGQLASSTGQLALAEAALLESRNGFISEGIGLEAAEVALELAELYLEQGRTVETRNLAAQLLPIFQTADLHDEALGALLVFQRAAQAEAASVALVREILTYFEQAKDDPGLKFRPSTRSLPVAER